MFAVREENGPGENRQRDGVQPDAGRERHDVAGGHADGPADDAGFVRVVRTAHEHVVGRRQQHQQQQRRLVQQVAVRGRHFGVLRLRQLRAQGVARDERQNHVRGHVQHRSAPAVHALNYPVHRESRNSTAIFFIVYDCSGIVPRGKGGGRQRGKSIFFLRSVVINGMGST